MKKVPLSLQKKIDRAVELELKIRSLKEEYNSIIEQVDSSGYDRVPSLSYDADLVYVESVRTSLDSNKVRNLLTKQELKEVTRKTPYSFYRLNIK